MKRFPFLFIFITAGLPLLAAADSVSKPDVFSDNPPLGGLNDILKFIGTISDFVANAFFIITTILFLYAGFLFLTAGDNPERTTRARKFLMWALIGVVVSLFAFGIFKFVDSILKSQGVSGVGGGGQLNCQPPLKEVCSGNFCQCLPE